MFRSSEEGTMMQRSQSLIITEELQTVVRDYSGLVIYSYTSI